MTLVSAPPKFHATIQDSSDRAASVAEKPRRHRVVIVGGGFGGLAVAQALGGQDGIDVTLVDRRNHHLFQPLLYQVATAILSPGEIAEPIRHILNPYDNIRVLLGELDAVDANRRAIVIEDGERIPYDSLVLATGAAHSYFGHDDWERTAPGLKTLDDARRIRARVLLSFEQAERTEDPAERERFTTFAVIGGGPTGVEMAGAIAGLAREALARDFKAVDPTKARILLIEGGQRILSAFHEDLSAYAEKALTGLGVTVMTGHAVEDVTPEGVTVDGRLIPTATVVWGAGVQASPVGRWLDLETDKAGRVRVAPDLSVPGREGVYVIGDAALSLAEDGSPLPGLAQVAHQQGVYLGRALRAKIQNGMPPKPFRFRSRGNLAVIGRNEAVVEWGRFRLKGFPAWLVWGIAHVYLLVGFQNRLLVCMRWLWTYLTAHNGARVIFDEDPDVLWEVESRRRRPQRS
ncbi:NAD(P)/FAD-dependent oxidoreductase [Microvirga pudoricolor]|uniref:NAD(P)/FAD-dependent oxidoreductase n=1 Tax=Microvirga pudoricolor TaxID=2778729 RepID=UPI00194F9942|nr:NAD(P)/FAD-dependent oxidoreductase [Microvirga pudoricolor]MBM6593897.1 NAD(P)/FAD-dependent oxidoreductase [Microvirga pudoricolor]